MIPGGPAPQTPPGELAPVTAPRAEVPIAVTEPSGARPAALLTTFDGDPVELCHAAVAALRTGDVTFGTGPVDYAIADLIEVLVELHLETALDLGSLTQVTDVARLVVEGWSDD